jgi:hypothetical protein
MTFRIAVLRCIVIVAVAVIVSVTLGCWPELRGTNDDGVSYFASGR